MNMEMFLFIVALILRIHSVRTDDYDIETTEMVTTDYVVPTTTTFMEDYEEVSYYTFWDEEIRVIKPRPNFDPNAYKHDVWNRKPYQPYTPLNIPNIDSFANWEPSTREFKVPTYTDDVRWGQKDYKFFFAFFSVVLLVMVTLKLLVCLRRYCESKKQKRDVPEQIVIIYSGAGSSQSDTVPLPSDSSSAPNRSLPLNFERGSDHPQLSYAKDLRFDSCRGSLNAYPELPPPYAYPEPPPPYQ